MIDFALKTVSETYGIDVEALRSSDRTEPLPEARRIFCYLFSKPSKKPTKTAIVVTGAINRERSIYYRYIEKATFEVKTYKNVTNKFKTIQRDMIAYLENVIKELESWLKNNPCFDAEIRQKKLERLADNKETLTYIINL